MTAICPYDPRKSTEKCLGQMVKAKLNGENHPKKHTHTHSEKEKKEKEKKKIYILKKKTKPATKPINKSPNDDNL